MSTNACVGKPNIWNNCTKMNNTEIKIEYANIYKGNIRSMKTILERFKENMNNREMFSHVIQNCDPPG